MKLVAGAIGILTLFAFFFGYHEWQEGRYALSAALAQTDKKVDYHIANQQREVLEYRLEKKMEEYKKSPNEDKMQIINDLKKRLAEKEKELKKLEEKK